MVDQREKFQKLLREIFQFDCADLDFGIYRIMNFKHEAIERFIQKDLIEAVGGELSSGILASQSRVAAELQDVAKQIRETLGSSALDGDGRLAEPFHNTPLGQRYLELQARASGAQSQAALEAAVFNHLYAFFSRYYDDGDFISKRRYGRRERYAIPYNGEEVYLHWANSDQYYVKTGEYFTDYLFKAPNGVNVHFKLRRANIEQNNNKGEKRFFVPLSQQAAYDPATREVVIPFEYRPLSEQEQVRYGQRNQQEAILAASLAAIPAALEGHGEVLAALAAAHHKTEDGTPVTYLEHHLRQYTRRNTSDFFVHKDLKGFLTRELNFYLKNEVLNLDEIDAGGEVRAAGWFQVMRAIRSIGGRIIAFLAQIEDFQKMIFEKRKFVTETQYCITVGNIPEEFHVEIAACEAQWQEWKALFHIEEEDAGLFAPSGDTGNRRIGFIKTHPTLVLDTKHFCEDFNDRLLGSFPDLNEVTDGLLVHGENFQALNLLAEKFREKVKCIYIDPPYNTGSDEFLYKDGYKGSSWISMLLDRVTVAKSILIHDGLFFMQIGDDEAARSRLLLDRIFPERKNTVIVRRGVKNVQAQFSDIARLTTGYDVIHVFARTPGIRIPHLRQAHQAEKPGKWDTFWRGVDRPTMRYELFGYKPESGQWRWEEGRAKKAIENYNYFLKHEASRNSLDEWYIENLQAGIELDFVRRNDDGVIQYYVPPQGYRLVSDNWLDIPSSGAFTTFQTEKGVELLRRIISWNTVSGDWVMDFFAGSGTTAHAVLSLNREDGGRRRFILVEAADYFDTLILPRVKKVIYAPEWRDGKPLRPARAEEAERGPRLIQYIRMESYEDALNNIEFNTQTSQLALKFDDYMLSYMLDWETRESPTRLNIKQLAAPFSYKLRINRNQETVERAVDIPETFAYLLGLHVTSRRVYSDGARRYLVYCGRLDERTVAVIWRETVGWEKADYERDRDFVAAQGIAEGADEVFVNGDSLIPGARSLDGEFKARMFAPAGV